MPARYRKRGNSLAFDSLGNKLAEGQLVEIYVNAPALKGRVKSISEGGISLVAQGNGKGPAQSLGNVVINLELVVQFDPSNPVCAGVLRLVDPEEEKVKAAVKM